MWECGDGVIMVEWEFRGGFRACAVWILDSGEGSLAGAKADGALTSGILGQFLSGW